MIKIRITVHRPSFLSVPDLASLGEHHIGIWFLIKFAACKFVRNSSKQSVPGFCSIFSKSEKLCSSVWYLFYFLFPFCFLLKVSDFSHIIGDLFLSLHLFSFRLYTVVIALDQAS